LLGRFWRCLEISPTGPFLPRNARVQSTHLTSCQTEPLQRPRPGFKLPSTTAWMHFKRVQIPASSWSPWRSCRMAGLRTPEQERKHCRNLRLSGHLNLARNRTLLLGSNTPAVARKNAANVQIGPSRTVGGTAGGTDDFLRPALKSGSRFTVASFCCQLSGSARHMAIGRTTARHEMKRAYVLLNGILADPNTCKESPTDAKS